MGGFSTGRKPWKSEPWRGETPSNQEASYSVRRRVLFFGIVIVFMFGILTLQLARMQLIDGAKYRQRAENNRLRETAILPVRGLIYDRNGVPLVENKATFAAAVVAADVPKERQSDIALQLQELTGIPAGNIEDEIDQRRDSIDPFTPDVIKSGLDQQQAFTLRERLSDLPGVRVIVEPTRDYPQGELVSEILGYVGPINEDEYQTLATAGYQLNDRIGKTGIEYSYESTLRGKPGVSEVEADASGRDLSVINQVPATPGSNVVLSIDLGLQKETEDVLHEYEGDSLNAAAIVIDIHTGEILSMVSLPTYDNNIFSGPVDENALQAIEDNPGKPLVNHAISEVYAPGSTFKQVTGLAALQEGIATADTTITSKGAIYVQNEYDPSITYRFGDWAVLGTLNFVRGVAMSSDVYFYYLSGGYSENGQQIFQGLGAQKLADWARRFGLGDKTGIDLPGEAEGLVPDPAWKKATFGEDWLLGDTYTFGIGQGYLATTPIQMLLVTAAVANGGDLLQPHLVKEIDTPDGKVINPYQQPVRRNLGIDPRNLDLMREGMHESVANGAAEAAHSDSVVIAGKTGTAEFGEKKPDGTYPEHAWFTGYAPFDNPQVAIVVFLEKGIGGVDAAPAASKILSWYFNQQNSAAGANP